MDSNDILILGGLFLLGGGFGLGVSKLASKIGDKVEETGEEHGRDVGKIQQDLTVALEKFRGTLPVKLVTEPTETIIESLPIPETIKSVSKLATIPLDSIYGFRIPFLDTLHTISSYDEPIQVSGIWTTPKELILKAPQIVKTGASVLWEKISFCQLNHAYILCF